MLEPLNALRGDYSHMRPDYTVDQGWDDYTEEEHDLFRRLYERQRKLLPGYACQEFIDCLEALHDDCSQIPRFDAVNRRLAKATGWQIVAVPGLVPDDVFFDHLANRRFPVTVWLRKPEEFDYIVEPDLFHDYFGHVPLLMHPVFADYMQQYGLGGLKAKGLGALTYLARLYWYTVEFGLINTPEGLRVYGAGILSSGGEILYALDSPVPNRIGFDLLRVMRTEYRIDAFQESYFVIDSYRKLFDDTAVDFTPLYRQLSDQPAIRPGDTLLEDHLFGIARH